jgi:alpha-galactosidase
MSDTFRAQRADAGLGGQATGDPALVHVNDADSAAFVRGADGALEEQTTTGSGAWPGC